MDPARIVRDGYDAIGEEYHRWSHASPVRIAYVERLLSLLPRDSTVLELGSGPGDPATRMLSSRHRVVGVELSAAQIAIARRHAPAASFVQADMTRLSVRRGSVDAIASFYALGHVPTDAQEALLRSFGSWLRPGGVLMTNAPRTPGDDVEDWLGTTMFFGGIGRDATVAALQAGGVRVTSVDDVDEGGGERFLWLTGRKEP